MWSPDRASLERARRSYLIALEDLEAETSVLRSHVIPNKQKDIHSAMVAGGHIE